MRDVRDGWRRCLPRAWRACVCAPRAWRPEPRACQSCAAYRRETEEGILVRLGERSTASRCQAVHVKAQSWLPHASTPARHPCCGTHAAQGTRCARELFGRRQTYKIGAFGEEEQVEQGRFCHRLRVYQPKLRAKFQEPGRRSRESGHGRYGAAACGRGVSRWPLARITDVSANESM